MKLCFSLALFLIFWLQQSTAAHASDKPNILLILIDDLGWNDTGYQGSDIPTPTIDQFASEGIRLQQYYVQRVCSPTRAALMAGRYPYHMGLARAVIGNGWPFGLPLNQTTIADQLKKGGYSTHIVGKWDLGMHEWAYTPTYRGFDSFFGFYGAMEDFYTHAIPGGNMPYVGIDLRQDTTPVTDKIGTYSTTMYTQAIEEIINEHDSDNGPFFIYAAYQSVHTPLQVPQEYLDECASIPYEFRRIICGMLRATDESIANITNLLKEKNLLDDTIIIFSTDNGGAAQWGSSNWPLRGNKNTVFEGGVRGTAFVWGSNLPKLNYDNEQLIHVTDWLPTIVEGIAGLELDKDEWELDGYNVWSAIIDDSESPRKEMLINLNPVYPGFMGQAAIRQGEWKLISGLPNCTVGFCPDGWVHLDGTIESGPYTPSFTWLFNIKDDPNERNNVADQYPEIVEALKARIDIYNSTHIEQLAPPFDYDSDPGKFGGVWTPWLG